MKQMLLTGAEGTRIWIGCVTQGRACGMERQRTSRAVGVSANPVNHSGDDRRFLTFYYLARSNYWLGYEPKNDKNKS